MPHVSVRIDSPCTQPWQAMKPDGSGRFCDHCRKTVVDFSGLTDAELARALAQQTGPACGRFRQNQLDRSLYRPGHISPPPRRLFGLLAVGLFGYQTVQAQTLPIHREVPAVVQANPAGTPVSSTDEGAAESTDSSRILTGRVIDQAGVGVAGARVTIKSASGWVSTETEGQFQLTVPAERRDNPLTLTISWIGYITQEIAIASGQNAPLSITLQEDTTALNEVIVVGHYRKPTFLERLRNRLPLKH